MEKVKNLIEAGSRTGIAIREVLLSDRKLTVAGFAELHKLNEKSVSNAINGNVRPSKELVAALVEELGGTDLEWRTLLWHAARPSELAS